MVLLLTLFPGVLQAAQRWGACTAYLAAKCFDTPRTCVVGLITDYSWGLAGPTVLQIEEGLAWVRRQRQEGRAVLVHCAHGHGRSTALLCAALVQSGLAVDFREAFSKVKAVRPKVKLNGPQYGSLVAWELQQKLNSQS